MWCVHESSIQYYKVGPNFCGYMTKGLCESSLYTEDLGRFLKNSHDCNKQNIISIKNIFLLQNVALENESRGAASPEALQLGEGPSGTRGSIPRQHWMTFSISCAAILGYFPYQNLSLQHQQSGSHLSGYPEGQLEPCFDYFKGPAVYLFSFDRLQPG